MNVTYSESVKQWKEGLELAQQGTKQLEEALGPAARQAAVEWDRTEDEKGPGSLHPPAPRSRG